MKSLFKRMLSIVLTLLMLVSVVSTAIVASSAASTANLVNVALGKTVTMTYGKELDRTDTIYNVASVTAALPDLTNGVKDDPDWSVNNADTSTTNPSEYVSFKKSVISGPYSFTVNLGSTYSAKSVSLYSYGRYDWSNVKPVDSVTYSVSTDGATWKEVGTVELADAVINEVYNSNYKLYVPIYEFKLDIDSSARYVKASFDNNSEGQIQLGEFEVYCEPLPENVASGKNVSFDYAENVQTHAYYDLASVQGALPLLTDGVKNCSVFSVNNVANNLIALGKNYIKGPYAFTVNLNGVYSIKQMSINAFMRTDYGVGVVDDVTFYVSADGKDWIEVDTVTKNQASSYVHPAESAVSIYTFTADCDYADMMYVKVAFDTPSDYSFIAFEEIEVLGTQKVMSNLALGLTKDTSKFTYEIEGGGSAKEPQGSGYTVAQAENSAISRITDGVQVNSSSVTYQSGWAYKPWNDTTTQKSKYMYLYGNGSRTLTVDLGEVCNIASMNMRFASLENVGYYAPGQLTYFVSEDGVTYYELKTISTGQAEKDTNDANIASSNTPPKHYCYRSGAININARYVKIKFSVLNHMLTDELVIYGSTVDSTTATPLTSFEKYDPEKAYVNAYATTDNSGGIKNEYIAYSGWYNSGASMSVKQTKEYLAAIAYLDENDVAQDWLFDSVIVMGHHDTARAGVVNSYVADKTSASSYANKNDWYQWLCYAFGKDTNGNDMTVSGVSTINLEALEQAAAKAKADLKDPDYKVSVKLCVYPAVHLQSNWGTVDGQKLDFTVKGAGSKEKALANRQKAYQWYIDTAIEMWENAGFEHLDLTGFYYYEEKVNEAEDSIAAEATISLADIIHSHETPSTNTLKNFTTSKGGRLYFFQIPYYNAQCYYNWAKYGFDYAILQPNYSFQAAADVYRLTETANLSKFYGMGFEMEFGGLTDEYLRKFPSYIDYAYTQGYTDSILGWYMGTWGCYQLSNGTNTNAGVVSVSYSPEYIRGLYDDIHDLIVAGRKTVKGDVNGDGELTINDATEIQKHLAHIAELTDKQLELADVNGDGKVSIRDVTTIQMKIAKLIY